MLTRHVLVETTIAALESEPAFSGFDDAAADGLRYEELRRHAEAGTLPATSSGQRGRPWMRGCHLPFKTYSPNALEIQPHDHFRLYPVSQQLAGQVINHDWEVSARVDWEGSDAGFRLGSVFVGLAGTTPRRSGPPRRAYVDGILRGVPKPEAHGLSIQGAYRADPAPGRLGDTATAAIGWCLTAESYQHDDDLVAGMALGTRWAWACLQDIVGREAAD